MFFKKFILLNHTPWESKVNAHVHLNFPTLFDCIASHRNDAVVIVFVYLVIFLSILFQKSLRKIPPFYKKISKEKTIFFLFIFMNIVCKSIQKNLIDFLENRMH